MLRVLPIQSHIRATQVFYVEESILGNAGKLLRLNHSGLELRCRSGVPYEAITLQFFGVSFGPDVVLPTILSTEPAASSLYGKIRLGGSVLGSNH